MTFELISNGVVAVLLIVMIGYCIMLNKRLDGLRKSHLELSKLVATLNQASERAQSSVQQLKTMGQEAEHALKMEVAKARSLADELSLITEAGNNLADRIERGVDRNKSASDKIVGSAATDESEDEDDWLLADDKRMSSSSGSTEKKHVSDIDILNKLRGTR